MTTPKLPHLSVLKFGGSCFTSHQDYLNIGKYLAKRIKKKPEKLIVIVSGINGMTNQLKKLGLKINPNIHPENLDNLLANNESIGNHLLQAALSTYAINAVSLNVFQVGLYATPEFNRGKITYIDTQFIRKSLQQYDIIIISGGQALTSDHRLVMLGRNSSDLTAIALAGALQLKQCELFSDVCGIYTSDPYITKNTRLLASVPFDMAIKISKCGAKVIYHRAVEHSKQHQVQILCKSFYKNEAILGTTIGTGNYHDLIIPNKKSTVWTVSNKKHYHCIRQWFHKNSIHAIFIADNIIIPDEVYALEQDLKLQQFDINLQKSQKQVSLLTKDKKIHHHIVNEKNLSSLSQNLHDQLYRSTHPLKNQPKPNKRLTNFQNLFGE